MQSALAGGPVTECHKADAVRALHLCRQGDATGNRPARTDYRVFTDKTLIRRGDQGRATSSTIHTCLTVAKLSKKFLGGNARF
ncbi:hypothetical protein PDE01_39090 [Paracoccus denitrificans]|nr:hypothetical protein PDE01_39090 [Paracoccus denitrificans]